MAWGVLVKLTLYLETSVVGAYLDNDDPFRRDLTLRWWEYDLGAYQAFVSPLVYHELEQLAEPYRSAYLNLIRPLPQLPLRDEATMLAAGYVGSGIFQRRFLADAFHVALASVHNIDFFVTWNFGHIASIHRQARVRRFNLISGFPCPIIVTPEFLVMTGI